MVFKVYVKSLTIILALVAMAVAQEFTTIPAMPGSEFPAAAEAQAIAEVPSVAAASAPLYASSDIVAYLNRRIRQLLKANPARNPAGLNLASAFNEERKKLEGFILTLPAPEDATVRAEQAVENFRSYAHHYGEIESMLEEALEDLSAYDEDPTLSVERHYQALMLVLKLRNSSTLKDAEKALRLFADFKSAVSKAMASNATDESDKELNLHRMDDEYREYFEEILSILRKHAVNDTMKVEHLLEEILMDVEDLKLSSSLRDLSTEENDSGESIFNLLSI